MVDAKRGGPNGGWPESRGVTLAIARMGRGLPSRIFNGILTKLRKHFVTLYTRNRQTGISPS